MKKLIAATLISGFAATAHADVGAFAGITYLFGDKGGLGFTVKALTTRKEEKAVGAIGVNFYPARSQQFGVDVGVGYQWQDAALILGYDVLNQNATVSGGWSDTKSKDAPTPSP